MHSCSIAHLDLSPKNVLFRWNVWTGLCAKIGDFGCCENIAAGETLQYTRKVTTWPYRSPEVALGLPYGHAADVWAVGVIARELATGRRLYELSSLTQCTDVQYVCFFTGPLSNTMWPEVESAPFWKPSMVQMDDDRLTRHGKFNEVGIGFARRLLGASPASRPTAAIASKDPYMVYAGMSKPKRLIKKTALVTPAFFPRRLTTKREGADTRRATAQKPVSRGASVARADAPAPRPRPAAAETSGSKVGALARSQGALCQCVGSCRQSKLVCGADFGRKRGCCENPVSDTEDGRRSAVCRAWR